jgi:hypothetical protein
MQLFQLLYGKSKKRMKPIMIDEKHKCQNYKDAREGSGVIGWHDIKPAEQGAIPWRQKSASIGDKRTGGYISKHGFCHHT